MRNHADLAAMVGLVGKHVAQHFQANWPGLTPAVATKFLDAAPVPTERFREHLGAASGAFGQSDASLLWRAMRAVELGRNLQVRSGQPDPFSADIVHVGEDRRNRARVSGWLRTPDSGVQMFDQELVDAIVGSEDLDCRSAERGR